MNSKGRWQATTTALQQVESLVATEVRALHRAQQRLAELMAKLQDQRRQADFLLSLTEDAVAGDLDTAAARRRTQSSVAEPVSPSLPAALRPAFTWIITLIQHLRQPECLATILERHELAQLLANHEPSRLEEEGDIITQQRVQLRGLNAHPELNG